MTGVVVGNLIAKLSIDTKDFEKGIKNANKQTEQLSKQMKNSTKELQSVSKKMTEVGDVSRKSLIFDSKAFNDGVKSASKSLDGFKTKLSGMAGSIAGALTNPITLACTAITGAIATAKSAFDSAEEMQKGVNKIRIGTGLKGADLADMEGIMKHIYGNSTADIDTISTALADLNTAYGLQGKELEDLTGTYLKFSKVTGGDVATSIADAREVFNKFGVDVKDQAGYLDYIFSLSQQTGAKSSDIFDIMKNNEQAFSMLGLNAHDAAAIIANAVKVNGKDAASNLMNGVMKAVMQASSEAVEEGGDNTAFLQNIKEFFDVATHTHGDKKAQMDLISQASGIFGARNAAGVTNALQAGVFNYGDTMMDALDYGDTLEDAIKDTETLGDKYTKLQHKIMGGMSSIGGGIASILLPVLNFVTDKVGGLFNWFMNIFENPGIQKGISSIGEAIGKVGDAIFGTGVNSEQLDSFFEILSETIVNVLVPTLNIIADVITNYIVPAINTLKEWIMLVFNFWCDRITGTLDILDGFYNFVLDSAESAMNGLLNLFINMWNGMINASQSALDVIASMPGIDQFLHLASRLGINKPDVTDRLLNPADIKIGRTTALADASSAVKAMQTTVNQTVNITTSGDINALEAQRGIEKANRQIMGSGY